MKWMLVLLICVAAGWFVWTRHPDWVPSAILSAIGPPALLTTVTENPTPGPTSTPPVQTRPESTTKPAAILATTPMPAGVYCLLERVSITTDSGIIGIPVGATVHLVKSTGSTLSVTDGESTFQVKPSQVTTDPEIAARVGRGEKKRTASIAAWQQVQYETAQAQLDGSRAAINRFNAARELQDRSNISSRWQTDFLGASEQARVENKNLLLDFTGSDWCKWCMKMEEEVLGKQEFKNYVVKNLVLVKLDFPDKKILPIGVKAQNDRLRAQYNVTGYPTFVLLDKDGRELGRLSGYYEGGPHVFTAMLDRFKKP